MPNHVHLIAAPETVDDLARAIGKAHRRYTRHINFRGGWRGYLDVFIEGLDKKPGPQPARTKGN